MSNNDLMLAVEARNTSKDKLEFEIGDTVDVHVRITEGEKSRIQLFNGTVIAMKHGGLRASFTVRRIVNGEGVERTFPIHSPAVTAVKIKRHGVARRSKLYYLRDRVGKATRLKERIVVRKKVEGEGKPKKRKRGAAAKAERQARALAEGKAPKGKKGKKKGKKKAKAQA